jgi:hypothetical protein
MAYDISQELPPWQARGFRPSPFLVPVLLRGGAGLSIVRRHI